MNFTASKIDPNLFRWTDGAIELFRDAGIRLEETSCKTSDDIIKNCMGSHALLVGAEPVTEQVMRSLPNLKVVARCGVGVDTVDVAAATRLGIQVTNVPDANFVEVATHTIAMALAMTRRLVPFNMQVQEGVWSGLKFGAGMRRPSSQQFGIIGFGRIGEQVGRRALAMGFKVAVTTLLEHERAAAVALGAQVMTFDDLIASSDIVSLHVPLTPGTKGLIDAGSLARMKPGSYLINVSRGGLVDEVALARSLSSGHLAGAALDVFEMEPVPADSAIVGAPNVILTPHIAYLSDDSLDEMITKAAQEVVAVLGGRKPRYPVNAI